MLKVFHNAIVAAAAEIKRWTRWIDEQRRQSSEAFVYFKHEARGGGPKFAPQMRAA